MFSSANVLLSGFIIMELNTHMDINRQSIIFKYSSVACRKTMSAKF